MNPDDRLKSLSRDQRAELCREVLEQLSDYLEGAAQEEFCRRVEEMLDGCQPFEAYCNTLKATISVARQCREPLEDWDEVYERSVEVVRKRVQD